MLCHINHKNLLFGLLYLYLCFYCAQFLTLKCFEYLLHNFYRFLISKSNLICHCYALMIFKENIWQGKKHFNVNFVLLQVQLMLVVDAFLTLVTWLPSNVYSSMAETSQVNVNYSLEQLQMLIKVFQFLTVLMLSNAFTTPIVYFIFNKNFRVRFYF